MRRILFTGFITFILSCSSEAPVKETIASPLSSPPPLDTTAEILRAIHAKEKASELSNYFNDLRKKRGFNGNVLIAQRGVVIYENAFGFKNCKIKDSLDLNSTFQLASVSKQFTSVAIMMLKEKGLLDYDDNVEKFIPGFPYKDITIHELLSHRSGLPNYMYFCDQFCDDKCTPVSNSDVFNLMETRRPGEYYRPGRKFNYSNTNYCILAGIVEKLSGMPFADFIKEKIFIPLHMNNSVVFSSVNNTPIPNEAVGHYYTKKPIERNYLNGVVGDKGIYTTVDDLFKWEQALYTNKLVKRTTLMEAFQPKNERRKNSNYGYGWRMFYLPDSTKVLFHGGWWQGFRNTLARIEKDSTSIIVLSNVENRSFTFYNLQDIFKILYPSAGNSEGIEEEE